MLRLPLITLAIGPYEVQAELAATEASRQFGLMHRQSLPENQGMLFVFDTPFRACFWMRNTPLPLSIAFIDEHGRITNMADMQPHSDTSHCANGPVRYALEIAQGWFAQHGIKPGQRIKGLPN